MSVPTPPRKRLPVRPSLEHLKKQAKRLVKREPTLSLAAAQQRLAREYGCRNWTELRRVVEAMNRGAEQLVDVPPTQRALPRAARARDLGELERILATGEFTPHDLDTALAHVTWYDGDNPATRPVRRQLFERLLAAGADPDGQYGSAYGPIVLGTGECLALDGLEWLLEAGCDVRFAPIDTKYGPASPLISTLSTYTRGRNRQKHAIIDLLLAAGAWMPPEVTPPLLAIHRGDTTALGVQLSDDPTLLERRFAALPYIDAPGGTLLHYAAAFGEVECAALLIARGADVNTRTTADGLTALHLAAWHGPAATCRFLLDHGARPWLEDQRGRTAADHAANSDRNAESAACTQLLTTLISDDPTLQRAVDALDAGAVDDLRHLLAQHPRLVQQRFPGTDALARGYCARPTLLHLIANNPTRTPSMPPRILESTAALLDAGAPVDACTDPDRNLPGSTALALVASSASAHAALLAGPLIELLVSRGADPAHGLEAAALHRLPDTVKALLRHGAPHSVVSTAALGALDPMRALLARWPEPEQLVRAGWAAAVNGQAPALELLLDFGLDPDVTLPRPYDPTLLHEAASFGHTQVVDLLLARGADRTRRDTQFHGTAADWARHAGFSALAERIEVEGEGE